MNIDKIVTARLDPSGWELHVGGWDWRGDCMSGDTIAEFLTHFEQFVEKVRRTYPTTIRV